MNHAVSTPFSGRSRRSLVIVTVIAMAVAGAIAVPRVKARAAGLGASFTINNVSADEGTGTGNVLTFTVTLSGLNLGGNSIRYGTNDGSATAPSDYSPKAGELSFPAGTTTQTIAIQLVGDSNPEPNETFTVHLSSPGSGSIDKFDGIGTIVNDDFALTVADVSHNEGDSGKTNAPMVISLSGARSVATTVNYATVAGTATEGVDYDKTTGTANIPAGALSTTINVPIIGDTLYEDDEQFTFVLSAPSSGVTLGDNSATVTIVNDDSPPANLPTLSVAPVSVPEGNSGTADVVIPVTLSAASAHTVMVSAATADATATAGVDYLSKTQTLTFAPGETEKDFAVTVKGDTIFENDETFTVNLSAPNAAAMVAAGHGSAAVTISNDDARPTLAVSSPTVNEGDTATFTVTLSGAAGSDIGLQAATADDTAMAPDDYTALFTTATVIAAGDTTATFAVPTKTDAIDEPDETFKLGVAEISDAQGDTVNPAVGTATIKDTNAAPTLSIADVAANEGNSGDTPFVFTVTLTGATAQTVTVNYATVDQTATAPSDYAENHGALSFSPGDTSKTITVAVHGDTAAEDDETFTVMLTAPINANFTRSTALGTITNDDATLIHPEFITTGAGPGGGSHVRNFDAANNPELPDSFFPYQGGPGVRVARGDLLGDGHDELIVSQGPGGNSVIQVFSGDGSTALASIEAYPGFNGGVYVAAGDVDGDGKDEIITAAGPGGGPHVRTFDLTGTPATGRSLTGSGGFYGMDPSFTGGLTVAAGDVNGDGKAEIIVGAASNSQPVVSVWDFNPATNTPTFKNNFLAYDPGFHGGVNVAAGDLDGDGKAEIVTGAGPGGGPHVRTFTGLGGGLPGSAFAYDPGFTGGVNVAVGDVNGDGVNEIITGAGPGGGPHVKTFNLDMQPQPTAFMAYSTDFHGGVFVAAGVN